MSQRQTLSQVEREQALTLFVAATSGEADARAIQTLREWEARSDAHGEEIRMLRALTRASGELRRDFPLPRRVKGSNRAAWWAAGAIAAAACVALWLLPPLVVEAGQLRPVNVDLRDGSTLTLDAGAKVEVSRLPWLRKVNVVRGRALFRVVHDDSIPFLVSAGPADLRDLGTRFLVDRRENQTHVSVFEGEVQINGGPILRLGQGAVVDATGLTPVHGVEEDSATSWTRGRLVVRDMPLVQLALRLSAYRPQPVRVDPAVGDLRVSGVFDIANQESGLKALEHVLPVRVRSDESGLLILAAAARK